MPELAQFQRDFAGSLEQPLAPATPMRVYLNTVLLGAVEALAANFPVCAMILGDRAFEALALPFARQHPPEIPVLAHYGRGLGDWLARQPISRELPYIADVARCEELHTAALHAADAPVLVPQTLETIPPEELMNLKLRLHPAARFGWLATPAMAIWLAHQDDGFETIEPDWQAGGALFTRPALRTQGFEIDPFSHRLLCGIRLGERLGVAARAAARLYPCTDIGASFAALVGQGSFVTTKP
jgi:hypothetical protein